MLLLNLLHMYIGKYVEKCNSRLQRRHYFRFSPMSISCYYIVL